MFSLLAFKARDKVGAVLLADDAEVFFAILVKISCCFGLVFVVVVVAVAVAVFIAFAVAS